MKEKRVVQSYSSMVLVVVQFACLFFLLFSGPLFNFNSYIFLLESFSIILALWSIKIMQASKLNVFPDLREGSTLIKKGPYRIIRHPMYLSVILFALSLLLMRFTVIRSFAFLILLVDMMLKIEFEEKLLSNDLPGYADYQVNSYKLIPLLY